MTFIGVDVGTTRIKALLYDPQADCTVVTRATPTIVSDIGDLRDADAVLQAVVACIDELISTVSPARRDDIEGIGVTSLSEEMVLLDAIGKPLGVMPTWYNHSAGGDAAAVRGIDPSFSWSKLRWAYEQIQSGDSGLFAGVRIQDLAMVTTLNSYVSGRLTGVARFAIDHSHASRTGFFDVREATWQDETFEATGWPATILPDLVPTGTILAGVSDDLSSRWGIPSSASIVLAGHDHFCGAFAVGVRSEGELFVSAGTSEAHCLIVRDIPKDVLPPQIGVGRYVDGEHFYLHRQLPSGHLYRQWKDILGLQGLSAAAEDAALLEVPLGANGTVVVPGLDTDIRSSVLSVGADATGHTLLRALLEGLACAALRIDRELIALSAQPITAVVASGVPTSSPLWRELRSHLSAAPLSISDDDESPALGAALLCQKSTTGINGLRPPTSPTRRDAAKIDEYAALYSRFEAATHRSSFAHPETATPKDRT